MTDTPPPALPPHVVEARLTTALHTIRATYDGSLEPQQRGVMIGHYVPSFPPLLIPAEVLDIRRDARLALNRWAWDVIHAADLHAQLYAGDVPALTHLLTVHAGTLAGLPDHDLALEQLEHAASTLAAISTPTTPPGTYLGACPLTHATDGTATPFAEKVETE